MLNRRWEWLQERPVPTVLEGIPGQFAAVLKPGRFLAGTEALIFDHAKALGLSPEASNARKIEFISGRIAASIALARSSSIDTNVRYCRDRSPKWPPGFVGSITHSEGFVWVVVSPLHHSRGLGIDSERMLPYAVANEIIDQVLRPEEKANLGEWQTRGNWSYEKLLTLIFSAKESLYKCLAPLLGYFEFQDAFLTQICFGDSSFAASLSSKFHDVFGTRFQLKGHFQVSEKTIHTGINWRAYD